MITSLDYGTQTALAAFGASNAITGGGGLIARNGGLVNSYTHTTLPNNVNQNHFATLPHQHHGHHQQVMIPGQQQQVSPTQHLQQQPQQHVRFGTLPNRSGSSVGNNNAKSSCNGNLAGLVTVVTTATGNGGNGHVTTIPASNNGLQQISTANS
ncbi:hypothetical protein BLA29_008036 [Euroglyphus maynei]|uniref:Uncharacterized protein n=1 Tax=Euroglyphus maynei TaxID=6958 RepID=A0A1Y3BFD1_EURMA|nr:hypothetical protein BLA29_008036 [Euroglyphus maynei]